jgi:crossover junction endodeoxyribonuclease RuvC
VIADPAPAGREPTSAPELRVLGLDPGSLHTGYGLLAISGRAARALEWGRWSVGGTVPLAVRLGRLVVALEELLERTRPEIVVIEKPFHAANSRSLIVLAEARGALLATLGRRGLELREYSPAEVKSAVSSNGRADKQQVARMVNLLLGLRDASLPSDAADALAVALCYAQRHRCEALARAPTT